MPVSKDNQQVSVVLKKELVKKIDIMAVQENRSRGYIIAQMIENTINNIKEEK